MGSWELLPTVLLVSFCFLVVVVSQHAFERFALKDMWNKLRSSGKQGELDLSSSEQVPFILLPVFTFRVCTFLSGLTVEFCFVFPTSSSLAPKITEHINDQPLRGNNGTFVVPGPVGDERWTKRANMGVSSQLAPPLTITLLLLSLGIQGEIPGRTNRPVFFCLKTCPEVRRRY